MTSISRIRPAGLLLALVFWIFVFALQSCSAANHQEQEPEPQAAQNSPEGREKAAVPLRPHVFFTDVDAGPVRGGPDNLGIPISIFGRGFGASRGNSRVSIGGVEVAAYMVWGEHNAHNKMLDLIVVQPGPKIEAGPIVVTVNGRASNIDHEFRASSGSIYYVAPGGSDSASCSASSACATILHSVADVMKPGDTLLVRGGTYPDGEIWIRVEQGGAPGRRKTIRNYPGEEVYLQNAARPFLVDANYITVSGFHFQNGKALNAVGWASRNQTSEWFINNTFTGKIEWAAVDTQGSDHVLAGNVCDLSGSSVGTMGHCYYLSQGKNLKVLYNIGNGAPGYGLHLYDEQRSGDDFQRIIEHVLVEGNLFEGSTQRSGMIVAMRDNGNRGNYINNITIRNNIFTGNNHVGLVIQGISRNVKIYHNTFFENGRLGLLISGDEAVNHVDVRNNLFFQTANNVCKVDCSWFNRVHLEVGNAVRDVIVSDNAYYPGAPAVRGQTDDHPVTGGVMFADPSRLDFHLLSSSAPVGRSSIVSEAATDWDGRTRGEGHAPDPGAFAYPASALPTHPQ